MTGEIAVIVTARNEAARLDATLAALAGAFPGARVVVADDASTDATGHLALQAGAELVRAPHRLGKGGTATLAARRLLDADAARVYVLCDGDLGASAGALARLVAALEGEPCDIAVAAFSRRVGGGVGAALGLSRRAVRDLTGLELNAPLSGQRALRGEALAAVVPFAAGFGMETAMAIDAHRAGFSIAEVELDLEHRASGRTLSGFLHRGRQARDIARAWLARRGGPGQGKAE